jgi:hypothetical protein
MVRSKSQLGLYRSWAMSTSCLRNSDPSPEKLRQDHKEE